MQEPVTQSFINFLPIFITQVILPTRLAKNPSVSRIFGEDSRKYRWAEALRVKMHEYFATKTPDRSIGVPTMVTHFKDIPVQQKASLLQYLVSQIWSRWA